MGTRTFAFFAALFVMTSAASAQTTTSDNASFMIPTTYALGSFESVVVTVATVPTTTVASTDDRPVVTATEIAIADGGDGISDAPDAGWQSERPATTIR